MNLCQKRDRYVLATQDDFLDQLRTPHALEVVLVCVVVG